MDTWMDMGTSMKRIITSQTLTWTTIKKNQIILKSKSVSEQLKYFMLKAERV